MTRAIVWSKDYCPYCVRAKALLDAKGIVYEERNISHGKWTKDQLIEAVPGARTVPQIFIGEELVGTFEDLRKYFEKSSDDTQ